MRNPFAVPVLALRELAVPRNQPNGHAPNTAPIALVHRLLLAYRGLLTGLMCLVAASISTVSASNDGPLILRSSGTTEIMTIINPSLGTIQLYRMDGDRLQQESAYNFLSDLALLSNAPVEQRWEWNWVRVNSPMSAPSYGEMFDKWLPSVSQSRRDQNGPSLVERARNSEDEFWATIPKYDGDVRGALGDDTLVLVIPSSYTILWYEMQDWKLELQGWRNYRADMFIPNVYNSSPSAQELFRLLPESSQKEWQDQQLQEAEALENNIEIAPSDPWVGVAVDGRREVFVLVDEPNQYVLTYESRSTAKGTELNLHAIRNMELDLMIPSTFNSLPLIDGAIEAYNRQLARIKEAPVSSAYIQQLLGQRGTRNSGGSSINAEVDNRQRLFVDLPFMRKVLVYRIFGRGNKLEMMAARDYSTEVGLALHQRDIQQRRRGSELLERCRRSAKRGNEQRVMGLLKTALSWNPFLGEEVAKDRKLNRYLKDQSELATLLEEAQAAADALRAEQEAIAAALAAEQAQ